MESRWILQGADSRAPVHCRTLWVIADNAVQDEQAAGSN